MGNFPTNDNKQKEVKHRAVLDATAGALAGAIAQFVVGPLDVLKIRFQVQLEPIARSQGAKSTSQLSMGSKYTGMRQALATIVKEEGIQVCSPNRRGHYIIKLLICSRGGAARSAG